MIEKLKSETTSLYSDLTEIESSAAINYRSAEIRQAIDNIRTRMTLLDESSQKYKSENIHADMTSFYSEFMKVGTKYVNVMKTIVENMKMN